MALRRAVERCREIVGEEPKSLAPQLREQYPDVAWADLAKIRDRLSHHYHRIDPGQLWVVAETDVPALAERLRQIKPAGKG